jgi:hypothetical protein
VSAGVQPRGAPADEEEVPGGLDDLGGGAREAPAQGGPHGVRLGEPPVDPPVQLGLLRKARTAEDDEAHRDVVEERRRDREGGRERPPVKNFHPSLGGGQEGRVFGRIVRAAVRLGGLVGPVGEAQDRPRGPRGVQGVRHGPVQLGPVRRLRADGDGVSRVGRGVVEDDPDAVRAFEDRLRAESTAVVESAGGKEGQRGFGKRPVRRAAERDGEGGDFQRRGPGSPEPGLNAIASRSREDDARLGHPGRRRALDAPFHGFVLGQGRQDVQPERHRDPGRQGSGGRRLDPQFEDLVGRAPRGPARGVEDGMEFVSAEAVEDELRPAALGGPARSGGFPPDRLRPDRRLELAVRPKHAEPPVGEVDRVRGETDGVEVDAPGGPVVRHVQARLGGAEPDGISAEPLHLDLGAALQAVDRPGRRGRRRVVGPLDLLSLPKDGPAPPDGGPRRGLGRPRRQELDRRTSPGKIQFPGSGAGVAERRPAARRAEARARAAGAGPSALGGPAAAAVPAGAAGLERGAEGAGLGASAEPARRAGRASHRVGTGDVSGQVDAADGAGLRDRARVLEERSRGRRPRKVQDGVLALAGAPEQQEECGGSSPIPHPCASACWVDPG